MTLMMMLIGCGGPEPTDVVWMEHMSYGWERFNHRLSFLHLELGEDGASAGVIGGTSTTNVVTDLPAGCDAATCNELPFIDFADVELGWARAELPANVTTGDITLVSEDTETATGTLTLVFPEKVKGDTTVLIRGIGVDTDQPTTGDNECYLPKNGWLPKRIHVELGTPKLVEGSKTDVTVPVSMTFAGGETLEDIRECLDAAVDESAVPMWVSVLGINAKKAEHSSGTVEHGIVYDWNDSSTSPTEQPPPDVSERKSPVTGNVMGWSAFDWTFHEGDVRGAYIRTLSATVDPAGGTASGHSTNYSPGTQQSGFDYNFVGTVSAVQFDDLEITRGTIVADDLPVELDEDGIPVIHPLKYTATGE